MIWDIFRAFNKQNPSKVQDNTPAAIILKQQMKQEFDLTKYKKIKEKRPNPIFVEKPGKNWGPGCKKRKALTDKINSIGGGKHESDKTLDI